MTTVINPQDFSHFVEVTFPDGGSLLGLTNNPLKINMSTINQAFIKSNLRISNKSKSPDPQVNFRNHTSTKHVDDEFTPVIFNGNKANVDMVISQTDEDKTVYVPDFCRKPQFNVNDYVTSMDSGEIFQVFVKDKITMTFNISNMTLVGHLKYLIQEKSGVPAHNIRLIYNGKSLAYDKTMEDYNITNNATIYMVLMLFGGMFHVTSGRNGNYENVQIVCDLDAF